MMRHHSHLVGSTFPPISETFYFSLLSNGTSVDVRQSVSVDSGSWWTLQSTFRSETSGSTGSMLDFQQPPGVVDRPTTGCGEGRRGGPSKTYGEGLLDTVGLPTLFTSKIYFGWGNFWCEVIHGHTHNPRYLS